MLASIKFDDEAALQTRKVKNIVSIRVLTAKLASFNLSAFQPLPQRAFRVGRLVAESLLQSCFANAWIRLAFHVHGRVGENPSPPNPPLEGEG